MRLSSQNSNVGKSHDGGCPLSEKGKMISQPTALTTHNLHDILPKSVRGYFHRQQRARKTHTVNPINTFAQASATS
jgi:hypothetical protein